MTYRVKAGFVSAETQVTEAGGRAVIDIPRGAELPGDVPDEQVQVLLAHGQIELVVGDTDEGGDGEKPLAKLKVGELKEYASQRGIDLGDAKKKDEIVVVIQEAEAAAAAEAAQSAETEDSGDGGDDSEDDENKDAE